ncbi:hypothetical protein CANARDRAFT_25648 [[Candida] arabinofermentans NRRL YB-2248]|uniref:Uncharacterized protein n=1 Tax=[Candida] arabinofermentans NRRL YB-2248 TaxID=983967 RepID=A0A1E4STA3_9ASCO|nr:hypothetical protein CANARDRAFT_25648 [[Candida] arabinofermentans NRRL YB-2248]
MFSTLIVENTRKQYFKKSKAKKKICEKCQADSNYVDTETTSPTNLCTHVKKNIRWVPVQLDQKYNKGADRIGKSQKKKFHEISNSENPANRSPLNHFDTAKETQNRSESQDQLFSSTLEWEIVDDRSIASDRRSTDLEETESLLILSPIPESITDLGSSEDFFQFENSPPGKEQRENSTSIPVLITISQPKERLEVRNLLQYEAPSLEDAGSIFEIRDDDEFEIDETTQPEEGVLQQHNGKQYFQDPQTSYFLSQESLLVHSNNGMSAMSLLNYYGSTLSGIPLTFSAKGHNPYKNLCALSLHFEPLYHTIAASSMVHLRKISVEALEDQNSVGQKQVSDILTISNPLEILTEILGTILCLSNVELLRSCYSSSLQRYLMLVNILLNKFIIKYGMTAFEERLRTDLTLRCSLYHLSYYDITGSLINFKDPILDKDIVIAVNRSGLNASISYLSDSYNLFGCSEEMFTILYIASRGNTEQASLLLQEMDLSDVDDVTWLSDLSDSDIADFKHVQGAWKYGAMIYLANLKSYKNGKKGIDLNSQLFVDTCVSKILRLGRQLTPGSGAEKQFFFGYLMAALTTRLQSEKEIILDFLDRMQKECGFLLFANIRELLTDYWRTNEDNYIWWIEFLKSRALEKSMLLYF